MDRLLRRHHRLPQRRGLLLRLRPAGRPATEDFGWSRASISGAFSLRTEVGGIAAPLVGVLVDRLGVRRLTSIGIVVVSIGFVTLSRCESLLAFYATTIVIAVGMSARAGRRPTWRSRNGPAASEVAPWA